MIIMKLMHNKSHRVIIASSMADRQTYFKGMVPDT